MSAAQPTTSTGEQPSLCANCNSTEHELKRCAKCKSVSYCNRQCQTEHWKQHKKECSRLAGERAPPSQSGSGSSSSAGQSSTANPFARLSDNSFLHNKSEKETFRMLVDILRLRQEDTYNFEGDTMAGTIYDGEPSSEAAFRDMLRRAKRVQGLLPPWWNNQKEKECIRENRQALQCAQEKSDIQEYWKDNFMPMKLRMVGEKIYGSTPGATGNSGQAMLQMQQFVEAGSSGFQSAHIDLNALMSGRH